MRYVLLLAVFVSSLLMCEMAVADPRVDAHTMLLLMFNEGSGDTARDLSGNGNHGELKGAEWVEGKFGKAVEFKKDGDSVIMPLSPALDLAEQLTVEAWVKPSSVATRMDIIRFVVSNETVLKSPRPPLQGGEMGFAHGARLPRIISSETAIGIISKHESGGYALIIDEGGIFRASFHIAGNYTPARSLTVLEEDKWYYLAATFDGESLKVYIDGELDGETPAKGEVASTDVSLAIGGNSGPGGVVSSFFFYGLVDELRVSDIARTPDETKEAMNSASPVHPSDKLTITWASVKTQY